MHWECSLSFFRNFLPSSYVLNCSLYWLYLKTWALIFSRWAFLDGRDPVVLVYPCSGMNLDISTYASRRLLHLLHKPWRVRLLCFELFLRFPWDERGLHSDVSTATHWCFNGYTLMLQRRPDISCGYQYTHTHARTHARTHAHTHTHICMPGCGVQVLEGLFSSPCKGRKIFINKCLIMNFQMNHLISCGHRTARPIIHTPSPDTSKKNMHSCIIRSLAHKSINSNAF